MTVILIWSLILGGTLSAKEMSPRGQPGVNAYCRDVRAKTAAVSITFDYKKARRNVGRDLRNPPNDARVFREWAKNTAPGGRHAEFNDANIPETKTEFLRKMVQGLGSAEYVNLNYSGHGHRLANGDWGFPLPTVPADLADYCLDRYKLEEVVTMDFSKAQKPKDPNEDCSRMKDYFVTGAELRSALKGKKVFAVLDACHAGSMSFDEGAAIVAQAQDKTATDGLGAEQNGLLTKTLKQMAEGCDVNPSSAEVTAHDLTSRFALIHKDETEVQAISTAFRSKSIPYSTHAHQQMALVQGKAEPWLQCVKMGDLNPDIQKACEKCQGLKPALHGSVKVSCLARKPPSRLGETPERPFLSPESRPADDDADTRP